MTPSQIDSALRTELGIDPTAIIKADYSYAWVWHCKIVTRLLQATSPPAMHEAYQQSRTFMQSQYGVDCKAQPHLIS